MNKRNLILMLALLLAAGAAVFVLKDWLAPEPIQIAYTVRPAPAPRKPPKAKTEAPSGKPGYNVTFAFNQKLVLSSVKVFPVQEILTNKYPHAIWNLAATSNTPAIKSLVYGDRLRGMQSTVKGATADTLEAGVAYRLIIEAGKLKAEKDFQIPR